MMNPRPWYQPQPQPPKRAPLLYWDEAALLTFVGVMCFALGALIF